MFIGANGYGQFSLPYDPDFAPPPAELVQEEPEPAPPSAETPEKTAPEAAAPELPEWLRGAGPFLLLDRQDPGRVLAVEESTAPAVSLQDFLLREKAFQVDQGAWNRMRESFEKGRLSEEEMELPGPPSGGLEPSAAVADVAAPPPPELELPTYGTSLSITGRKVIGFNFSEKRYLNQQKRSGRPASTNLLDINQQLQLRMQGKVGPKITVNVDYDDTKLNKQDISVVYTGDPNEVVQNASFGDIDLSLPSTEFVSYNKQLFGIRVDIKYKGFRAIFIGSRTKGTSKSKQFRGNTQLISQDILDTNYFRRRYYDLTFGDPARLPIRSGSERVYLSRQTAGQLNVNEQNLTVDDLAVPSSTFTGTFVQLSAGLDYTVDYAKGIVTFKNTLEPAEVVAVDFTDALGSQISAQSSTSSAIIGGGTGRYKLIKDFADVSIATTAESGWQREIKTFYSLGRSQVVRDDGRGNFFLRVLDQNRTETGSTLNPRQVYPDTIDVDFENGTFQLKQPFSVGNASPTVPDSQVYAPSPITKRIIQVEYRFRLKTFFLEPNLVLQSEVVLLDGRKLTRNVDYFIDYESGFLTFFNEDRIAENAVIDVTFEVAPFVGNATESLLGTRVSYDIFSKWSIGSTLLYQSGSKPQTVPSVTELAKSLLVYEFDTQLKDLRLASWLSASFQGELAKSIENPNLSKFALVENMEGVKQDDSTGLLDSFWRIAATPVTGAADPATTVWSHFDEKVKNINPKAAAKDEDTQKVLKLDYDFAVAGSSEASIVYVFSPTGIDFSQKSILEVTLMQSSMTLNDIDFHLGGVNEDADGDGVLDSEDLNLDNLLQPDEDLGYLYDPVGKTTKRYGAANGFVDSEDLNKNGRLDSGDFSGRHFGYLGNNQLYDATDKSTYTGLGFAAGAYHTFQIPLEISATDYARWQAVKEMRISVRKNPGGAAQGSLNIARVAVVGNSWQLGKAGDPALTLQLGATEHPTLIVNAVNNVDNAEYSGRAIFQSPGAAQGVFNDLYGSIDELKKQGNTDNLQEQSLALGYRDLNAGTVVHTKRVFARAINISQHGSFDFLLYGNADLSDCTLAAAADLDGKKVFFLRAGSEKDYYEVQVPINFCGWQKISVTQADLTGDQVPDAWQIGAAPDGSVALSTGRPNLQQIGSLIAGVRSLADTKNSGSVYLNEVHLSNPLTRKGTAYRGQADFSVPGWMSFGGKYRYVDRNYETPTTMVSNQDNRQINGYLSFSRLSFFPMNFNYAHSRVETPNVNATGNLSNTVSLLSAGRVETESLTASGNFSLGAYPKLTLSHERNSIDYALARRLDARRTYRGGLTYSVPWKSRLLPRSVETNYSRSSYDVEYAGLENRLGETLFNTNELTHAYGGRLVFEPWNGSNFSPSFNATQVKEDRRDFLTGRESRQTYPKSYNQGVGFNSTWRLLRWFIPAVSYTVNTIENNNLQVTTVTVRGTDHRFEIGEIKTLNRNANGNISLTLNAAEILTHTKLWRSFSLTNGYQITDGDVWNNVERDMDTRTRFWLRSPLRPGGPAAQRANLTLRDNFTSSQRWSPLEAYELGGRGAALQTLSISNNFTKSVQRSETTGTPSKTISTTLPDLIASLSQIEKLTFTERWLKNFQINLKYSLRETLNVATSREKSDSFGTDLRSIVKDRFDTSLSFNLRSSKNEDLRINRVTQKSDHKDATLQSTFDLNKFRFTPKVDYAHDVSALGTGQKTADIQVVTPSLLIRADISMPQGLKLPFRDKPLPFTNRIIWTTTLSMAMRSSPVTISDNSKLANFNTSADYEISKNLRMTLNASASRLWHKYLKEEDYLAYQFGTVLTLQF